MRSYVMKRENKYFTVVSSSEAMTVGGGSKVSDAAEIIGYLVGKWVAICKKKLQEKEVGTASV